MTPLQQTIALALHVDHERRLVTGCLFFLVGVSLQAVWFCSESAAQPLLLRSDAPVLTESENRPAVADPEFLTGRDFEDALKKTLSLAWQGQNLRDGLRKISETRQVAILLDRRVDPGQQLSLQVQNVSLQALLKLIATEARADISVLDTFIYVGPAATAARLRTVEEIAASQLVSDRPATISVGTSTSPQTRRSFELLERSTLIWPDLARPRELLEEIARRYSLTIEPTDKVPHDLWGQAVVPSATPSQLLVAVLGQFDLSFEWTDNRDGIRIVEIPADPRIERTFTLKRGTESAILAELSQRIPGLEPQVTGRKVTVVGTVEQLEIVETLIHPERSPTPLRPNQRLTGGGVTTFTFAADAPLLAFLNTLEKQAGYEFKYDVEAFEAAGIRLDKRIRLEASELTAQEVFQKMFPPQNIAFKVDGKTVYLTPAAR